MAYAEKCGKNTWRVRYPADDGTLGSISGFPTKTAAQNAADEINVDKRRGTFHDPAAGRITLAEWAVPWFDALDVGPNTTVQYESLFRNHLEPRWGQTSLSSITGIGVTTWAKKKRAEGYARSTTATMVKLLAMMLSDAADENMIIANPIRPNRRGRRRHERTIERIWTTPEKALRIALHAAALGGIWAGILVLTAAWTGARWGELLGLQRHNLNLDLGTLTIHHDTGALLEIGGHFELGPPKTAESARSVSLPPFLIALLTYLLTTHTHPFVFLTPDHGHPRRSNFSRRIMRPAADGTLRHPRHRLHLPPTEPGLTVHGLRHSHKTWMIADGIPEVAQARRLGHRVPDKIQDIYSHVAPEVETRLLTNLQHRWDTALATLTQLATHETALDTPLLQLAAA
ncbi:tyrosine-type recombinase/integrase [Actinokineospora diospyrosa]|uniref:Site-specific recombinase XerD n=1 Tax=Actinokineospora diospyrosa TaxID=103728 RepID=A0ABT1IA19_9PSEU|nr:tyrosine-type recombinase/integrase [Actinokineospora diospyrosa]MCP2269206.1 Site-specific recombinase XerD [Actinokineospora diospyrosa]